MDHLSAHRSLLLPRREDQVNGGSRCGSRIKFHTCERRVNGRRPEAGQFPRRSLRLHGLSFSSRQKSHQKWPGKAKIISQMKPAIDCSMTTPSCFFGWRMMDHSAAQPRPRIGWYRINPWHEKAVINMLTLESCTRILPRCFRAVQVTMPINSGQWLHAEEVPVRVFFCLSFDCCFRTYLPVPANRWLWKLKSSLKFEMWKEN